MAKKHERKNAKYTEAFRRQAVERMKESNNLLALARELGIDKRLLYDWRDRAGDLSDQRSPANRKARQQETELRELKRLLAEKTLEVDFFRGALQKVAARRQASGDSGETASTTKSGKRCACKAD
ncbi:MAG TPA: transposase [Pyrinomonadaceae bacterium]|nr:transposase [Pyrinomonadaceae bacterium]